jgi:hypothetical protein
MGASSTDETPAISFINSNKNKRLLSIAGYIFYQNKSTPKVTYWKCEQKSCSAAVHLDSNDRFIKFNSADHTHMPVPERIEIRKLMTSVKARVIHESTAIGQIYQEELAKANLSRSALAFASTAREASKRTFVLLSMQSVVLCRIHSQSITSINNTESPDLDRFRYSTEI